ncbi:GEVED domain-containing protein [Chryseobacterium sp. OSA05B]|uniref:T9SS type A sorting domain-containing protein n=1 Tax=Chryseobacterium sp. OSA05B TaxID=2862650 RepID=UPI001CC173D7|nr:GEVED domain-containing protein [Chryseobacterium sp. OSA05B]
MTRNLFFMLLFLTGAPQFQAAHHKENLLTKKMFTAPANVTVSNINPTSADVTWDPVPGSNGYTVRFRPLSGGAWVAVVVSAGTACNLSGLTPCTGYVVQVTDNVSGDISAPVTFYTQLNYCQAGSVDETMMHLSKVMMTPSTGLPQMVSASGASNYTDYRLDLTRRIQLGIGTTNNVLSVEQNWAGTPGTVYVRAWIDFNSNGVFESSEMMMSGSVNSTAPKTSTFSVPPFVTASQCGTTMRVMTSQTVPTGSCGTFTYGEVEDYGVTFVNQTLAVDEISKSKEISIYPNPASEVLHISGLSSDMDYEIFSASGQKTGEGRTSENTVDIRHLAKGIYFIQLKNKENTTRVKFIKK